MTSDSHRVKALLTPMQFLALQVALEEYADRNPGTQMAVSARKAQQKLTSPRSRRSSR